MSPNTLPGASDAGFELPPDAMDPAVKGPVRPLNLAQADEVQDTTAANLGNLLGVDPDAIMWDELPEADGTPERS